MDVNGPSIYASEIADQICDLIVAGKSLRSICTQADMPAASTVFKWLTLHSEFAEQYARAREAQAEAIFDDILSISDDGTNDWMEIADKNGEAIGWRENGEAINRSKLRVDARKWMAGKLKPKKYGEKIEIDHTGSISAVSDEQLDARIANLLAQTGTATAS